MSVSRTFSLSEWRVDDVYDSSASMHAVPCFYFPPITLSFVVVILRQDSVCKVYSLPHCRFCLALCTIITRSKRLNERIKMNIRIYFLRWTNFKKYMLNAADQVIFTKGSLNAHKDGSILDTYRLQRYIGTLCSG